MSDKTYNEEDVKKANIIHYQNTKDNKIDKIAKNCNLERWKKYIAPNMRSKKVSLKFDSEIEL